jgi:hypothetical protein
MAIRNFFIAELGFRIRMKMYSVGTQLLRYSAKRAARIIC